MFDRFYTVLNGRFPKQSIKKMLALPKNRFIMFSNTEIRVVLWNTVLPSSAKIRFALNNILQVAKNVTKENGNGNQSKIFHGTRCIDRVD